MQSIEGGGEGTSTESSLEYVNCNRQPGLGISSKPSPNNFVNPAVFSRRRLHTEQKPCLDPFRKQATTCLGNMCERF